MLQSDPSLDMKASNIYILWKEGISSIHERGGKNVKMSNFLE